MNLKKDWKGYDIEDLRIRRATTALKIKLEQERLKSAFSSCFGNRCNGRESAGAFNIATEAITAVQSGIKAYRTARNVLVLVKNCFK